MNVYAVDLDRVHAAVGSKDEQLLRLVETACAKELAEDLREPDKNGPTLAGALRGVIMGETDSRFGQRRYYQAYELICLALSEWSDNLGPYIGGEWLETADSGFDALDIEYSIGFTCFEASRCPGGFEVEYGGYGEWTHEACVEAAAQWAAITDEQCGDLDPDVLDWVETGIDWAEAAAESPSLGIAGFFTI